jgi:glycosyltransferase involved in cell wall biosynthesis
VRLELGVTREMVILHSSNLRPVKRIDLLLEAAARVRPREAFRLVILAGEDFTPFANDVHRLGLGGQVVVLERVSDIEDYLQAADLALFASDSESFCLGILEAMCFGCPSIATSVGGIPEVVADGISGILVSPGDAAALAHAVEALISDQARCASLGDAARQRARALFSADVIVPAYEAVYRRVCGAG